MAWMDGLDASGYPLVPPPAEDGTEVTGYVVLGMAYGVGEQHYRAHWSDETQAWEWVLVGPTAQLTDVVTGEVVGSHGGGPAWGGATWTADSDSSTAQAAIAPGFQPGHPTDRVAPLKLYTTTATSGGGSVMGNVQVIQRLQTQGGHPGPLPESLVEKSVPYSATYVFWGDPPRD